MLRPREHEEPGYGLYSYALLSHRPQQGELPQYRAYMKALLALPKASDLANYVPKIRINITCLPMATIPSDWEKLSADERVDAVLEHYDYARAEVMLASLPERPGTGPVILSVLAPLDVTTHPHPVLVQDLTHAQPALMETYVNAFVQQAGQERFWKESALASFQIGLRNTLEVLAAGLGMSRTAVQSWLQFLK
jgi:hypothetical protein